MVDPSSGKTYYVDFVNKKTTWVRPKPLASMNDVGAALPAIVHQDSGDIPEGFLCPITLELMDDPYIASDGHTYEKQAISEWLGKHDTSPKTGAVMPSKAILP